LGTEERSVTQLKLTPQLALDRCPHCGVAKPTATAVHHFQTASHDNREGRFWRVYQCTTCGGVITAASPYGIDGVITEVYPKTLQVHDSIPDPRAHTFRSPLRVPRLGPSCWPRAPLTRCSRRRGSRRESSILESN